MTRILSPIQLISAPYDSGLHDARMGAGPTSLRTEAARRLRVVGHPVNEHPVSLGGWRAELRTAFDLHHAVAAAVAARAPGEFPILLAGNCNTNLGVVAGSRLPGERQGLIWMDAHADFETPATDATGFLDGQGLSMAVGRSWQAAMARLEGFAALREENVVLVGARSLGAAEERALADSAIRVLVPDAARDVDRTTAELSRLATRVDAVHLHVDLDVYDTSVGTANGWSTPGGLGEDDVLGFVELVAARLPLRSASLASYDPESDADGRIGEVALRLIERIAALAVVG